MSHYQETTVFCVLFLCMQQVLVYSNATLYVQCNTFSDWMAQIFADINYMIDDIKQFAYAKTIDLFNLKCNFCLFIRKCLRMEITVLYLQTSIVIYGRKYTFTGSIMHHIASVKLVCNHQIKNWCLQILKCYSYLLIFLFYEIKKNCGKYYKKLAW